ncbi:MAG: DUF2207 domain-containing protein [Clostridiaceae bacterium]|nr:DUF2207 domain-containing protein [Clostridiaceae bacterium]
MGLRHGANKRIVRDRLFLFLSLSLIFLSVFLSIGFTSQASSDSSQDLVFNRDLVSVRILQDGRVLVDETISFTVLKNIEQLPLILRNPTEGNSQLQALEYFGSDTSENFVSIPAYDETIAQNFSYRSSSTLRETRLTLNLPLSPGQHNIHISYEWNRGVAKRDTLAIMEGPMSSLPVGLVVAFAEWSVQLPANLSIEDMKSVTISSTPFIELNKTENSIIYRSQGQLTVESKTALLLTAPRSAFSTLTDTTSQKPIPERLEEARGQINLLHNRVRMRQFLPPIIIISSIFSFSIWLLIAFLRRLPWLHSKRDHSLEIALTPEVYLKILMDKKNDGRDILSSLLSLMTKRELTWEDEIIVWNYPGRDDFSNFTAWEAYLLQWLFDPTEDPNPVLAAQRLRRETRGLQKHRDFQERYKSFQELVLNDFRQLGWVNRILTVFKRLSFQLLGLLDMILALLLSTYARSGWPLILLLPGLLLIISGGKQLTFTKHGYALYREMRVYLRNISSSQDLISNNEPGLTDVETVISALPRAVIFGKIEDFFAGIRDLDPRRFHRAAYALLHVYRSIPLPVWTDGPRSPLPNAEEMAFLKQELATMEEQIISWDALFRISLTS